MIKIMSSGNYLNNVMAFMQAKREKAFDSIMLNHKGYVTQVNPLKVSTSHSNINEEGGEIIPLRYLEKKFIKNKYYYDYKNDDLETKDMYIQEYIKSDQTKLLNCKDINSN